MNWTREQREAIETTGRSLLVSAAAGSGKTAVLAERCAYLICDAPQPCDVDELLVVTFTKSAAAEMRGRIELALRNRWEQAHDQRLTRQLMLLDRARIATIHGFCADFLRRHFNEAGIDPNFRVLDEEEVRLLKTDVARELLDERYKSEEFQRFIDLYANGNDRSLLHRITQVHELLCSLVDPLGWLNRAQAGIAVAAGARKLSDSEIGRELADVIRQRLGELRARWVQIAGHASRVEGLEPYLEYANNLRSAVEFWQQTFADGNFDALSAEVAGFEPQRLPTFKNPPSEKEIIQRQIDAARKLMTAGPLAAMCRFTEQQWRDGLTATLSPTEVFTQLIRDFGNRFSQAKRELQGVDFSDLERFTLNVLRSNPTGDDLAPSNIARIYHRQFRHVLVDEYQDVNDVQDALLHLLSRESAAEGNLFSVGDIKQSIYRFRMAQPQRFLKRYEALKLKGQAIDLRANFRSRAPLLDGINALFERLMTRQAMEIEYDESHKLIAGAEFPKPTGGKGFVGAPIELHLIPPPPKGSSAPDHAGDADIDSDRTEREAAFVAHRIHELMAAGMKVADKDADGHAVLRPLQHRDIVVLLRSMKVKSNQFVDALRAARVPVHSDSGTGFFDSMEINDMRALLRVLDNQQQDIALAAVLRSPLAGLENPDDSLARIRLAYPDGKIAFHEAVSRYAAEQKDALATRLSSLFTTLNDWRTLARQRPLAEVLWHIYNATGYLAFCSGLDGGAQRVANLIDLHERARQFGSFQRQGLSRFMEFLDSLADQTDLGQPSIASEADDVVRVMSIHRSKGLEFPVVIVPDLGKAHNLQDAHTSILVDRDGGIGMLVADEARQIKYPSAAHMLVRERIRRQTLAEEMRILYVAMTRAREHLILTGTCDPETATAWDDVWSHHRGPLSNETLLGAKTMLDWIGPASAAIGGSGAGKHLMQVTSHAEEEVRKWTLAAERKPAMTPQQLRLVRLETPASPAKAYPEAAAVIQRLEARYPYHQLSLVAATASVGSLTKQGRTAPAGSGGSFEPAVGFETELAIPKCVSTETKPSATEIGSAVHLVLQHLDFARPCDADDLRAQLNQLLTSKLLDQSMAASVDLPAIQWLLSTPLGELIRKHAKELRREVPIYYPIPAPGGASTDPLDRVMVRGKIDLLIPEPPGWVVVDFKTDRVTEETVDARAEFYRPQVQSYATAISGISAMPVKSAALVFLTARVIREM